MEMDINNFNKDIKLLKESQKQAGSTLHPLRKAELKQILLSQIQSEHPVEVYKIIQRERRMSIIRYIATTVLGISLVGGTALASNGAKPGDVLFPVKKIKENIQITLTTNEQARAQLQEKIAEDRLNSLLEIAGTTAATQPADTAAPQNGASVNPQSTQNTDVQNQGNENEQEDPVQHEAEDEFSNAIKHLQETQTKLQAQGQNDAATQIGNAITQLQLKSETRQNRKHGGDNNNNGQDENNDGGQDQNNGGSNGGDIKPTGRNNGRNGQNQNIIPGNIPTEPNMPLNPTNQLDTNLQNNLHTGVQLQTELHHNGGQNTNTTDQNKNQQNNQDSEHHD